MKGITVVAVLFVFTILMLIIVLGNLHANTMRQAGLTEYAALLQAVKNLDDHVGEDVRIRLPDYIKSVMLIESTEPYRGEYTGTRTCGFTENSYICGKCPDTGKFFVSIDVDETLKPSVADMIKTGVFDPEELGSKAKLFGATDVCYALPFLGEIQTPVEEIEKDHYLMKSNNKNGASVLSLFGDKEEVREYCIRLRKSDTGTITRIGIVGSDECK